MWAHSILLITLCWALCLANTDLIHLDMSTVRGSKPPSTVTYPIRTPPPAIPPEQDPDVFCTDGQSPDDFFCDMRRFYGSNRWTSRYAPDIYDFDLKYPHHRNNGVVCTATFQKTDNRTAMTTLRLPFNSFDCEGGSGTEAGLPPFRMSSVTTLTVTTRRPTAYHYRCKFVFQNTGSEGRSSGGRANGTRVLMFHYLHHTCIAPIVFGRETIDPPAETICGARRCRPREN